MTKLKREFLIENKITKTVETTHEEYSQIKEKNPDKIVEFVNSHGHMDVNEKRYIIDTDTYVIINEDMTHEDIVEEALFAINKKAKIIMWCALFFTIVTIVSMITTFVITNKIAKVTDVYEEIYSFEDNDYYDYLD